MIYAYGTATSQPEDGPFVVDDTTTVVVTDDNDIKIVQRKMSKHSPGSTLAIVGVTVTDPDALARAIFQAQLVQAERRMHDDRPMTPDHRKAIFAALRDTYDDLTRERRLSILSAIVQRPVLSLSTGPHVPMPLTRAEASHVLDVLNA